MVYQGKMVVLICISASILLTSCAIKPAVTPNAGGNNTAMAPIVEKNIFNSSTNSNSSEPRAQFKWQGQSEHQVAPGYEIEISNPSDPQLNGRFRIRFDGVLELPYGIKITSNGLSDSQLKQKIVLAYSNFFQTPPTLQINIVDKRYWVEVRGLVNKPGQYLVRKESSLDEVISAAGGLQTSSSKEGSSGMLARFIRIDQGGESNLIDLDDYFAGELEVNPIWQGGEVVFLQSEKGGNSLAANRDGRFVQVLGQVRQPGEYPFKEGGDFFYYMVRAGGPNDRADMGRVEVIRNESGVKHYMMFDLQEVENRGALPEIKGGDVLIVHADNPTPTERKTRLYSEIASIVTSFATIIILAVTL